MQAGYPVDKIQVICLARDPLSTLVSWLNMFSYNREKTTLFKNFILAYKSIEQFQEDAQALGISVSCYVHEAIRDNDPSLVIRTLFERVGVTFTPQAISGWQSLPRFGTPESRIVFSVEPAIYWGKEFHLSVANAQALQYVSRNVEMLKDLIPFNWQETMLENKIWDIYNNLRIECIKRLGLPIEEAKTS